MINYARHDEEFYGVFKLSTGEELLAKAVLTEDNDETLAFLQNPVTLEVFTKEIDENKVAKGIGFVDWFPSSDEDFYILREKDIISLATMSKEYSMMYEAYLAGSMKSDTDNKKIDLDTNYFEKSAEINENQKKIMKDKSVNEK